MPGNNLQAKLFLSVAGGDPPDIINQDDPVIPDWASRGVIDPVDQVASPQAAQQLQDWMLPAASRLSTFDDRMYGICNALDIRALYYNQTMLERHDLSPPQTISDLDHIAETIAPAGQTDFKSLGFLPDSRRLMAWSYVFGGDFINSETGKIQTKSPSTIAAANWMSSYRGRYGADQIAAFRKTDQALPGGSFYLLPVGDQSVEGRYAVMMDGQWRVRNILAFQKSRRSRSLPVPEFGVCPLPAPDSKKFPNSVPRKNAGWVNGNFFVFPHGAKNPSGAYAFAKFWIGLDSPSIAAATCQQGGWIPVSQSVIETEQFKSYLATNPMFAQFVALASSENQFPTPPVVGAAKFKRELENAGFQLMNVPNSSPDEVLK